MYGLGRPGHGLCYLGRRRSSSRRNVCKPSGQQRLQMHHTTASTSSLHNSKGNTIAQQRPQRHNTRESTTRRQPYAHYTIMAAHTPDTDDCQSTAWQRAQTHHRASAMHLPTATAKPPRPATTVQTNRVSRVAITALYSITLFFSDLAVFRRRISLRLPFVIHHLIRGGHG